MYFRRRWFRTRSEKMWTKAHFLAKIRNESIVDKSTIFGQDQKGWTNTTFWHRKDRNLWTKAQFLPRSEKNLWTKAHFGLVVSGLDDAMTPQLDVSWL
jgi:hypothetical protein